MTQQQVDDIGRSDSSSRDGGRRPEQSPVDVGSMLFTLVEPHRGHEVAYNRWYERDHFYAGCLNGAFNFAGRRWVATREHKQLRYPADSSIVADPMAGSYLALYWVLDGHHQEWNRWAYRELKQLHEDGRMFAERDHVHTLLYTRDWVAYRDDDPVPAALALDHPFAGLAVVIGEAAHTRTETDAWYRDEHLPKAMAGSSAAMCLAFSPMPLLVDAPGVEKDEGDDRRFCHLYFLDRDPLEAWEPDGFAGHGEALEQAGAGRVLWAGGFIPTIPGTDTYTDRLW